MRKRISKNW